MKTRLHNIRTLNPKAEENVQIYKKLAKKGFLRVSGLCDRFDDKEVLLCGQDYRKGKRPGNIKLSPDRQFLILK